MTTPTWSSLSVDNSLVLRTAASRLAEEFIGTFGTETIELFLHSSYDQLARQAAVTKFLPLMAERFARQRLSAVARVEGLHRDGKPPCCSCAPTMPAGPKWPSDSLRL